MERAKRRSSPSYDLPKTNQLEISLFGPGYGECIVVHYGDGHWFTIDSCLEDDCTTPSALAYLNRLGAELTSCVRYNIITHPDGDHIGGISELFSACSSARLVCPALITEREMAGYNAYNSMVDPTPLTRTTREIVEVLGLSFDRPPGSPLYVKQDTLIMNESGVRLTGLAPSDQKVRRFLNRVSRQLPGVNTGRRAPGKLLPNEVSAALLLEMENFTAIFGADLEETPGKGWTTVLDTSIAFKIAEAPNAYKVAHHGSNNADCARLWGSMNNPVAVLAPFKRGINKIPTQEDTERILQHTKSAFSTSSFRTQQLKRLSRADKALYDHRIRHRDLYPKNGHIRLRVDVGGTINVDLFESAVHLSKVH
ncbi:MAG: hypothetical protein HKM94_01440 [Halobacteria archaeon]|nr:hypothetical protein [Halobacteria archaeon]